MRAALELGRWTFPAPLGYLNAPKWSKTSLIRDPERGPLVRRAFEDLATGNYTKQEVIARATEAGLRSRKGLRLSPQSFGQMMRNPIYVGRVDSPDYGISTQGDFEPLVDEATFYRAQAVLDGRILVAGPRQRNHPDFPLRGFVRCEACGRPLTGSWSKGRNGHYASYHCQRQCRAVNVSKAELEGAFADELALLQPTAGYMRLVNGPDSPRLGTATGRSEGPDCGAGEARQGHPAEARSPGRGVPVRAEHRRDELRTATRQAPRGADPRRATTTPRPSTNSTYRAFWPSQNAFCRAPQTCGSRRRSTTSSGCSSCSFRKGSRSTEFDSIEPP